uniref:Translation initiation factor IF-2 n=1 Tax=Haemonchus contortus TaxID=6289 RepID=A0A7I4Y9S6_HAECO
MNIEDLAKREENAGRKPVKKKGYDDVEFTDISVHEDNKKKDKQPKNTSKDKDVKDGDKKKKDAAAPKKNEKQAASKAKQGRAHAAGNDPADQHKKEPSAEEKNIQQKIVPLPKIVEKPSAEKTKKSGKRKRNKKGK